MSELFRLSACPQPSDIKKLAESGVTTADQVIRLPKRKLVAIKGISDAKAEKLREAACKVAHKPGFQTAKDVQAQRDCSATRSASNAPPKNPRPSKCLPPRRPSVSSLGLRPRTAEVVRVTTGCDELNHLFGGGIESGAITEFAGEFRTGKTQLCLTLCVTSFLPRAIGGGEGRAMFLDTEGTFRPERLGPIAARFELDHDFVMENVLHQRVLNCDHLDECLQEAAAVLADDSDGPFRVLIVDSIIALYRQEFPGRGELSERQQRIGKVMQDLKSLSEVFNLAVILSKR